MKTKNNFKKSATIYTIAFSFFFSVPVFSGGPDHHHKSIRPERELMKLYIRLQSQTEKFSTSLVYDAADYDVTDNERNDLNSIRARLTKLTHIIELETAYTAPALTEINAQDQEII